MKISILYLLQKNRTNQQGNCPIRCRITYFSKRKIFSTGLFINPDFWNSKKQKAFPPNQENDYINSQLSLISQKIKKAFLLLQVQEKDFDVNDVYQVYKGKNTKKNKSFLEVMELHNSRIEKLVGIEYAPKYYQKWKGMHTLLSGFIKKTYNRSDFLLGKLTLKFLDDIDFYMKSEKNHKQITINKCIQRVRQVVRYAISEGYLEKDPFILYKPKRYKKEVVYLTKEELELVEKHKFAQMRLEQVRDMFIFCCYTGLAYAEMSNLKSKHIVTGFDGKEWIKMHRKKTGKDFSVPLLEKPIQIIEKYGDTKTEKILPKISNQKFNSYIKEICEIVGIEKNISHHIARKTFATTVLLYNDVPMEIVSELLGHSKIQTTQQHYGKIVQKKVSEEMSKLTSKLNNYDNK
ncbi:MAG: site-specific integrase [Flavobacteriales bacterium]|uniref:site-specific integrase n=1 Tax=Candidatus Ulvibacter alkanivorans TaxID=2267620 RepID=UPI000DF2AC11|nr:site-specific integrase [Candidatus Ulvibacter alkanivorans]MCH2488705.1 site-specific integrase [Flavobacteriales bacterium]